MLWGFFPAFWPLLDPAAPIEVLAHRVVWTLVLMAAVLSLLHGWRELRRLSGRGWLTVTAAALCIAGNWGLFIYGVAVDRWWRSRSGYDTSPLFSVLLGVLVLRERPRVAQWVALSVASAAVLVISVGNGAVPWIGLGLGVSFGVYGLLKTVARRRQPDRRGRGAHPLAAVYLVALQLLGTGRYRARRGARVAADRGRPGDRGAAAALRRRRAPAAADHAGHLLYITPTLQSCGRAGGRRTHAGGPLDRVRDGVGGAGHLHGRPGPGHPARAPPATFVSAERC